MLTRVGDPGLQQLLQSSGLMSSDLAPLIRQGATDAGKFLRNLQELQLALKAKKTPLNEFETGVLDEVGKTVDKYKTPTLASTWQQIENIRRTLMTMHSGTAFANAIGSTGRVGLDVIENYVDALVSKVTGTPQTVQPGLQVIERLMHSVDTMHKVEKVMESFPGLSHRLFNMHLEGKLQDARGIGGAIDKTLYKAQDVADTLNWLNRTQEYAFRNAVLAARLDGKLRARGLTFDEVANNNMVSAISVDDVKFAVDEALDMTFAKQYHQPGAAYHFINFVNKSGLTTLMPFPRFFINAMDYTISRSPLGILKFATEAERKRIAAGDTRLISQMVTGTAMFYTAYQLLDAGAVIEQGRRLLLPDGRTIDLQRYNPYAAYFVVADLAKRKKEGRLHNVDIQKLAKSLGPDWRAGTGMAALDGALDSILGTSSGEKGKGMSGFKAVTGEYAGSFLTPLSMFVDAADQFKNWAGHTAKERDTRGSFSGPILRNIPFAKDTLPERQLPTRSPLTREAPGARLFSASVGPKLSPFERWAADNQGKSINNLLPGTGLPDYDRSLAKAARLTGFRQKLDAVVSSPDFKRMRPDEQVEKIREMAGQARAEAEELAEQLDPKNAEKAQVLRLTPEQHSIIQRRYGRVTRETIKMYRESRE